jgi:hypothetical protein
MIGVIANGNHSLTANKTLTQIADPAVIKDIKNDGAYNLTKIHENDCLRFHKIAVHFMHNSLNSLIYGVVGRRKNLAWKVQTTDRA